MLTLTFPDGRTAVLSLDPFRWECADRNLQAALNALLNPEGYSPVIPDVPAYVARQAARLFDADLEDTRPPRVHVPGTIY